MGFLLFVDKTTNDLKHKESNMIRERFEQTNLFETLLPLKEVKLDPELQGISDFLDAHPEIQRCFTEQALGRLKNLKTLGRPSESPKAVFRMLILCRHHASGFRETSKLVSDSLTLRSFTRIYCESLPTYQPRKSVR